MKTKAIAKPTQIHKGLSLEAAAEHIANGGRVYRWNDYWSGWYELVGLRVEEWTGLWDFEERSLSDNTIRHHSTQLRRYDRLTIERP